MSFKAKNLTYEKPDEPEFLQRMREQVSGRGDADRHDLATPRRRGLAKVEALADDAPVIVGEDGNVLQEHEVQAIRDSSDITSPGIQHLETQDRNQCGESKVEGLLGHGIGPARKKRKAVKVASDEDDVNHQSNEAASKKLTAADSAAVKPPTKKKKRAKVTLSFDDPDEG